MHWVSLHLLCFFCSVLGSNLAARGGNLKVTKPGGLGGRAQRLLPDAFVVG